MMGDFLHLGIEMCNLLRPPASATIVAHAAKDVRARFGIDLPEDYCAFLRVSDGLDYNGLVLYSAADAPDTAEGGFWQGLVATNLEWRADPANADLLVLGDSDLDLYVWRPAQRHFARMDRIGRDRATSYPSCEAMIDVALRGRL